jgi:hypothetical protein
MSETNTVLDAIKSIASKGESGRLEINSSGMYGTLLFVEGKLVDARLESLSGFQAVNAVVALRDVQFSFDHVPPAAHSSTISPGERVVLKRFFGIEAAEMGAASDHAEVDPDWNATPEQVVPLAEVDDVSVRGASFSWLRIAAPLALLLALTVGLIAVRSKLGSRQQGAPVATIVSPEPPRDDEPAANVQDLTGEWRVINTVEKTTYKSFDNMQVGFRLVINQQGKEFTARGESYPENGRPLPVRHRTPIHVTGSIDGDKVVATFVEDGRMRQTNGRFVWKLQKGGLAGTFISTAANSSGRSSLTKL